MLTDTWLKNAKGKTYPKEFEKADRDGLGVRVSAKGKIVFQSRYRLNGKPKRPSLGTYPFTTLKQARALNTELREVLDAGKDPELFLAKRQRSKDSDDSLKYWFMQWYVKDCEPKKNNPKQILRSFEIHVFPVIGSYSLGDVGVDEWFSVLEAVAAKVPSIADRILTNAKQCYKWLKRRKAVEVNPLTEITAWADLGVRKKNSYRSLSDEELSLVIEALEESRMTLRNKLFCKIYMIYGCRPKELKLAEPQHVDFDAGVWTIPPENHKTGKKTGKPLIRPITEPLDDLFNQSLRFSENNYIFSGAGGVGCMSDVVSGCWNYNLMQWVKRHRGINMDHWSLYDLRKTARTNWSRLTAPHVAEVMLGHTLPGDWQTYDQYHYLDEQREALKAWTAHLVDLGMKL